MGKGIVNPLRHPQALFAGFEASDPRLEAMRQLVGETRVLTDPTEDFKHLRAQDWDLLVVEGLDVDVQVHAAPHMYVLAFDCRWVGMGRSGTRDGWTSLVGYTGVQRGRTLRVPDGLEPALRRLVEAETVPAVDAQETLRYLGSADQPLERYAAEHCQPFLLDADGHAVAGAFRRSSQSKSVCWALPHRSDHPELWLAVALETWAPDYPDRFPATSPWRARPQWMTAEEQRVADKQAELKEERDRALRELGEREQVLAAEAAIAKARANNGARRLLTAQGEDLVQAVRAAFERLGFGVRDVDATRELEGLSKVEDLCLTCPDTGLRIITEVKGLTGGAKQSDLHQLARHAAKFAVRHRATPDRQWYVVNQFKNDDPDTRGVALASAPEAVQLFAEDGGLLIDTRPLFSIVRHVESGALDPAKARQLLTSSRGVLAYSGPDRGTD